MGLPRFYGDYLVNFRKIFLALLPGLIGSLSIDGNPILYEVSERMFNYGSYYDEKRQAEIEKLLASPEGRQQLETNWHNAVINELETLILRYRPQNCLCLCFDGVAPVLKMQHQRQRRFKSTLNQYPGKNNFDSTSISPGTDRMRALDVKIKEWLNKMWLQGKLAARIIYSGSDIPGEGEHKIMEYFRQGLITNSTDVNNNAITHIVHGIDSDLSLLCLGLNRSNIILVRNFRTDQRDGFIPIDALRSSIIETLGAESSIEDFIALVALIGNDFMPPVPGLGIVPNNMELLINAYKQMSTPLVYQNELQLAGVRQLLTILVNNRANIYMNLNKYSEHPYPLSPDTITITDVTPPAQVAGVIPQPVIDIKINYDQLYYEWYHQWGPQGVEVMEPYLNSLPSELIEALDNAQSWATEIAVDFIRVWRWIVIYYLKGMNFINTNLTYPHFRAPLLETMLDYADSIATWPDNKPNNNSEYQLTVLHQMLAILPNREVLPKFLANIATNRLLDYYPQNFVIDFAGVPDAKRYKIAVPGVVKIPDQAIAYIPFIDPYRLVQTLTGIRITAEQNKTYAKGTLLVLDTGTASGQYARQQYSFQQFSKDPRRFVTGHAIPIGKKGGGTVAYAKNLSDVPGDVKATYDDYKLTEQLAAIISRATKRPYDALNALERWLLVNAEDDPNNIFGRKVDIGTDLETGAPVTVGSNMENNNKFITELNEAIKQPANIGRQLFRQLQEAIEKYSPQTPSLDVPKFEPNKVSYRDFTLFLPKERLSIFRQRGTDWQIIAMILRYASLLSKGQQWAIPQEIYAKSVATLNVTVEGFASPLNSQLLILSLNSTSPLAFCSLFPDLDRPFGSRGSFFDVNLVNLITVVNPPFIESVLARAAKYCLSQMEKSEGTGFIFYGPEWVDALYYDILTKSKYYKGHTVLLANKHYYMQGGQKILARFNSVVIAIGNIDNKQLKDILNYYASTLPEPVERKGGYQGRKKP